MRDKAAYLLTRLLGPALAAEAIAAGPAWREGAGRTLIWEAASGRFRAALA